MCSCIDNAELPLDDRTRWSNERLIAYEFSSWNTSSCICKDSGDSCQTDPGTGATFSPITGNYFIGNATSELIVEPNGEPGGVGTGAADDDICNYDRVAFTSSTAGVGTDNWSGGSADQTEKQKARTLTLSYEDKSCIVITFSVPMQYTAENSSEPVLPKYSITNRYDNDENNNNKPLGYGRNFLIDGGVCEPRPPQMCKYPTSPPSPTSPPETVPRPPSAPPSPLPPPPSPSSPSTLLPSNLLCPTPTNKPCRVTSECTEGETCIPYRNRRLVRGSATKVKDRMRKRGLRKLLFYVAPVVGTCGYTAGDNARPDGTVCTHARR